MSESLLCSKLTTYRRADGNRRLWSGADTQGSNERVRPSGPACAAVFGPGIPRLQPWGAVNLWTDATRCLILAARG
jgi:hypothetical protein